MLRLLIPAALVASPFVHAHAQPAAREPARPRAAEIADTNDATAYFDYGVSVFEREPPRAAAAFYWASRINPGLADALYARRAAALMSNAGLRKTFISGGRRARESKELLAVDSLYYRALKLNPFLYRRLDRRLLTSHIREEAKTAMRRYGDNTTSDVELNHVIEVWLRDAGPEFRGWLAYGDGHFKTALDYYASALKSAKFKAGIRIERARILGMTGALDSAITEFQLALDEMRKRDTKDIVFFYDSKAVIEHSIAMLLEQKDDLAGAREAYGHALQEDLSFYPAHLRLGLLALTAKDTATAVSELDLAVQIAGEEPFVRYVYGWALTSLGRFPEAVEQLDRAIALEPYFALPYIVLGQAHERLGDAARAEAAYSAFLARASQKDAQRALATERLADVRQFLKSAGRQP